MGKKWAFWVSLLSLCTLAAMAQPPDIQVHDGDTFRMDGVKVRLHGVDAPEINQPYGPQSRDVLNRLLHETLASDQPVTLHCVGKSYKRRVCDVQAGSTDVAAWMVQHGAAWDDAHYSRGQFIPLQTEAKARHQGLWAGRNPMEPKLFRSLQRDLQQAASTQ